MAPAQLLLLAALRQPPARILADRLKHPEALIRVPEKALVHERLQRVEIGVRDPLGRLEGAAAAEDGKAGEQPLLVFREEVVAPIDRRAQRLLARPGVASCLEQIEPLRKTLEDLGRGEDARAGRGQLEREG